MTLHFLKDVANEAESAQNSKNYLIIASLKSETIGKLINRIPSLHLLIATLPGSALRMHVEALPGKLDIKRHLYLSIILYRTSCF